MHYADSSFIVSLVLVDAATPATVAAYRSMGRVRLFFTDLHVMEVRNTIRRIEYQQALELPVRLRAQAAKNRERAEVRLETFLKRGIFVRTFTDWQHGMEGFRRLSEAHTARLGCRTFDTLHVSFAQMLRCESFATVDGKQAALASAAGLKTRLVHVDD